MHITMCIGSHVNDMEVKMLHVQAFNSIVVCKCFGDVSCCCDCRVNAQLFLMCQVNFVALQSASVLSRADWKGLTACVHKSAGM